MTEAGQRSARPRIEASKGADLPRDGDARDRFPPRLSFEYSNPAKATSRGSFSLVD